MKILNFMFTGIVESLADVVEIKEHQKNLSITLSCPFVDELQIDQSINHDGVCLTVVEKNEHTYTVDVIQETLSKTTIGQWQHGDEVNLERSVTMQHRLDGHLVQGHIDTTLSCIKKEDEEGSYRFWFQLPEQWAPYVIAKGSISINGVSLTIADLEDGQFSVAIIPYTYQHTNFKHLSKGDNVNIEFDVIGKYVNRISQYKKKEG